MSTSRHPELGLRRGENPFWALQTPERTIQRFSQVYPQLVLVTCQEPEFDE